MRIIINYEKNGISLMRVIAGTARGHKLVAPNGLNTRPTLDRVKENLFNILRPYLHGARFLDLFGGSGAIGIEALSQGAKESVFVEHRTHAAKVIRQNLIHTKLINQGRILNMQVWRAIELLSKERTFDIIYIDPPYKSDITEKVINTLGNANLLHENGLLAVEMHQSAPLPDVKRYTIKNFKEYGNTKMIFYANIVYNEAENENNKGV